MLLATLRRDRPDELRADMQQYYGLNLDGMGTAYSYAHAACLCAQLPDGARVHRGTAREWTTDTYLMANMEHTLRVLAWQNSEDGQKGVRYPKHVDTPAALEQLERRVESTRRNRAWVEERLAHKQPQGGE